MKHSAESLGMAFGYLTAEEIKFLKRIAQGLKKTPTVVNIGAGSGTSGLSFMESRDDLFLYTIDVTDAASPFGCLEAERTVLTEAGFELNIRNHQIHSDSKDAGKDWKNKIVRPPHRFVDLVFIDGEHSYEGCRGDVESWVDNIKTNGFIAIHDYDKETAFKNQFKEGQPHPKPWPGVDQTVKEMLKDPRFQLVEIVDSLILLRKMRV